MLDLIVIGGGAAGYAAALRTAQLGGKVLLVEKNKLGGTCLHRGCIPSKVLFQQSATVEDYQAALKSGLLENGAVIKLEAVAKRQAEVVERLFLGLEDLFKKRDVAVIQGRALVEEVGRVRIENELKKVYETKNILIAVGSREKSPPFPGIKNILGAEESLTLPQQPCSVAVIGGGNTGLELASAYISFGFDVTVMEKEKVLLPSLQDEEMSKWLGFLLKRRGLKILTGTDLKTIEQAEKSGKKKLKINFSRSGTAGLLEVDRIIVASGREPRLDVFTPGFTGVKYSADGILVNIRMETTQKGIYAAGDVTGEPMLAHRAYFEGITAAENIMGMDRELDLKAVPAYLAARPGVAWVGITEKQAGDLGLDPQVGRFSFGASGAAVLKGKGEGFVQLVTGKNGVILGMQVLGDAAEELIMEGTLAVRHGLTVKQLKETMHPHPTLHESIWEICLSLDGLPMHG